jgi:hypothetical protein
MCEPTVKALAFSSLAAAARYARLRETAEQYAFLLQTLGLE